MGFFKNFAALFRYDKAISEKEAQIRGLEQRKAAAAQACAAACAKQSQAEQDQKTAEEKLERTEKQLATQKNKVGKLKLAYQSMVYSLENFSPDPALHEEVDDLAPTVRLKLHSEDLQSLRKQMRENDKTITEILEKYRGRYTTKANAAIYSLMVIALRAELQNVLFALKYDRVEKAIESVKAVTEKYLKIAGDGNQSIAGTLTNFIGEIEYLFIRAVQIEYEYYVQKERIKEEQRALREQMRLEREEQKRLAEEQQKVEAETAKYLSEIKSVKERLRSADDSESEIYQKRIAELEAMLESLSQRKEEIIQLQKGKAGFIYIISNIGAFGENVFKVGMTRRLEPQERIDELGSASVPFPFDVHSLIFSSDAPALETALHRELNLMRVNRVNLRKEFFRVSLDDMEELVLKHDPTAEFNRTILAEQYRQSLSMGDTVLGELPSLDEEDDDASETAEYTAEI